MRASITGMLAKLPTMHQLTLPKLVPEAIGPERAPGYVEVKDGRIFFTLARAGSADAVRGRLAEIGISEADVAEALAGPSVTD